MTTVETQRSVRDTIRTRDLTSEELLVLAIMLPSESRRKIYAELDLRAARAEIEAILRGPSSSGGASETNLGAESHSRGLVPRVAGALRRSEGAERPAFAIDSSHPIGVAG
ncbi:MAG: hypothetical protein IPJ41_12995 [Phycisphaerales bacterium]|nr:hypothetical protein [Phycisphaerales bacterium]